MAKRALDPATQSHVVFEQIVAFAKRPTRRELLIMDRATQAEKVELERRLDAVVKMNRIGSARSLRIATSLTLQVVMNAHMKGVIRHMENELGKKKR